MKKIASGLLKVILIFVCVMFMQGISAADEFTYEAKDRRDPFVPLITGEKRMSVGLEAVENIEDIKFEGVIFDPSGKSIAVLNGEIVKEGEKIYNLEIVKIDVRAVTLKIYDKVYTINLIEEGGETVEK